MQGENTTKINGNTVNRLHIFSLILHTSSFKFCSCKFQVIFKSCKLIPVMIGSVIILGKRYSFAEVLACICMCVGLIWFTLADSTVQPKFSATGKFVSLLIIKPYVFQSRNTWFLSHHDMRKKIQIDICHVSIDIYEIFQLSVFF